MPYGIKFEPASTTTDKWELVWRRQDSAGYIAREAWPYDTRRSHIEDRAHTLNRMYAAYCTVTPPSAIAGERAVAKVDISFQRGELEIVRNALSRAAIDWERSERSSTNEEARRIFAADWMAATALITRIEAALGLTPERSNDSR